VPLAYHLNGFETTCLSFRLCEGDKKEIKERILEGRERRRRI